MRKGFQWLAIAFLSAFACSATAAGTSSTSQFQRLGFRARMLDASVPQAERMRLFSQVIALANSGQTRAQDLAGTMYWQGSKINGSPLQRNLQHAQRLLANAAIHGDVPAMAKLAEMQLAAGHTAKAMVWAQLYAHYRAPDKSARSVHGYRFAYASDLIQRVVAAGGKVDDAISRDVYGVVRKYDPSIRAGIDAFRDWKRSGNPRLITQPTVARLRGKTAQLSGVAEFLMAFDPSGKPTQVWTLASYPTGHEAPLVRSWLDTVRANPVHGDAGTRYRVVTIKLRGIKEKGLRAHHG